MFRAITWLPWFVYLNEKRLSLSPEDWRAIVSGERRGLKAALIRAGLWWVRFPYGLGVRLRNRFFDWGWKRQYRAPVPVVGIGNLTLGGTGKTPCVEWVARFYRQHEVRVAILSRGYGTQGGRNDEAMLLEQNLPDVPHLQGIDRVALAQTAVEELESEVLVLDDGFQHRRLARDLDVVLIDATNPWGYGYLFPRGAMREPIRGLRRASVVMITRADQVEASVIDAIRQNIRRKTEAPIVVTCHAPTELSSVGGKVSDLQELRGKPIAAFCGIGNPQAFRHTIERLAGPPIDFRVYPDHHEYTREDVDTLHRWAEGLPQDVLVLTTQKDLVKLPLALLGDRSLWALRIALTFREGQETLEQMLMHLC